MCYLKLYNIYNVNLVGRYNGLECYIGFCIFIRFYIIIIIILGSFSSIGSLFLGPTELGFRFGFRFITSRAASRSKLVRIKLDLKKVF